MCGTDWVTLLLAQRKAKSESEVKKVKLGYTIVRSKA